MTLNELQAMNQTMDFRPEKRKAAGDLKNIGSILRDLPEEFRGLVKIRMLREAKNYQAEFMLQNGFIIAASISCAEDGAQLFGEKAFLSLVDLIKDSSGGVEAYDVSDQEFRQYIGANESSLLEMVRNLGRTLEEIGRVDEDIRKGGLVDLEAEWKELEAKWKQFEEREKPYLEMILKADAKPAAEDSVVYEQPPVTEISQAAETTAQSPTLKDANIKQIPPETPSHAPQVPPEICAAKTQEQTQAPPETDKDVAYDDKGIDEMILREDPWEQISKSIVPGTLPENKDKSPAPPAQDSSEESREAGMLRQHLQGTIHAGAETEDSVEGERSRTLSDDFNKRVRDAILGKSHHRLSENAVSAPRLKSEPLTQAGSVAEEPKSSEKNNAEPAADEWLARANATLLRLRKKKEEQASAAVQAPPAPSPAPKPTPAPVDKVQEQAPPQDAVVPESRQPAQAPEMSTLEGASAEAQVQEWDQKVSSEISQLKKETDVYWGWDKKKKRFVGAPVESDKKPDEAPAQPSPDPRLRTPFTHSAVLREELRKQVAAADAREIVISKEEVTQAMAAAQAAQSAPPGPVIPELKKKISFMDKLKYAKYPQIIKVMEKVDGKKSIDDLSRETKLAPAAVKYVVDKLAADGYVSIKVSS